MKRPEALGLLFLLLAVVGCAGPGADNGDDDNDSASPDDDDLNDDATDDDAADDVADDDAVDDDTAGDFSHEIFTHTFDSELTGVATGDFYDPAYAYPPIPVAANYSNVLNFQMSPMLPPWRKPLPTSGPLILFDQEMNVLVFSPLDHFFISLIEFKDGRIHYGIEGEVEKIPAGFTHRFLLVRGRGLNATVAHWGKLINEDRGRTPPGRYADNGLSYLGYWTDNGAYYYYQTEPGLNEADTLLAVKDDADARGIPYGYFQLDSWWYFKTPGLLSPGGLIRWEPQPQMFPDGLTAFQEQLGLPLVAHNRWFAIENDYVDDYEFVFDTEMALPVKRDLFDHFIDDAVAWGIETYEQDWLMAQFFGLAYLRNHVAHAEDWMAHINDAAAARGLTVQLCMAGGAHLMDAVDRGAVTTARTSIDYRRDISKESYWPQFHTVNLLAAALGVWPFKDNFHSSEGSGEAEALISSLSAGMVGAGDRLGLAEVDLLHRTCRDDGLLLKPDRPATPLDAMFLPHQRPYLTSTYSDRPGLGRWTYLAAYLLAREHPERTLLDVLWAYISYGGRYVGSMFVFPDAVTDWRVNLTQDLGLDESTVLYNWRTGKARVVEGSFEMRPIAHLYDYAYFILAPILDNGLALIGETGKYVTLADRRFTAITVEPDALRLTVAGVPSEQVTLRAYDTRTAKLLNPVTVTIGADGAAQAVLPRE